MGVLSARGPETALETARLTLRPWRVAEAPVQRELWAERDPRVPPHRRLDEAGRPTLEEIEAWIRDGSRAPGSACWPSSAGPRATSSGTAG